MHPYAVSRPVAPARPCRHKKGLQGRPWSSDGYSYLLERDVIIKFRRGGSGG